jgi:uncharacterized protein
MSAGPRPPSRAPARIVLPVFPLPDVTLFPQTHLPLHVFEARYRAMVTDALAGDRRLCVAALRPGYETTYAGKPPVHGVAGVGEIVEWERLPSGRYNIVVRGDGRVRLERELPTDTLYRMVAARRLDEAEPADDAAPVVARIRSTCEDLLRAVNRPPRLLDSVLAAASAPGAIADRIAAAFVPDAALRQELLETLDVGRRLDRLAGVLTALRGELEGRRE